MDKFINRIHEKPSDTAVNRPSSSPTLSTPTKHTSASTSSSTSSATSPTTAPHTNSSGSSVVRRKPAFSIVQSLRRPTLVVPSGDIVKQGTLAKKVSQYTRSTYTHILLQRNTTALLKALGCTEYLFMLFFLGWK